MSQILIHNLIRQVRELQEGSLWFDQSIKGKIDALSDEQAFSKSIPEVHSVAEQVSHMLEWRKECLLRFKGERTNLMNSADDWKNDIELKLLGWTELKKLMYQSTETLIAALADQDDSYLDTLFLDTEYTFHYLIEGIIQHDLYHLGQIGITVKLLSLQ